MSFIERKAYNQQMTVARRIYGINVIIYEHRDSNPKNICRFDWIERILIYLSIYPNFDNKP